MTDFEAALNVYLWILDGMFIFIYLITYFSFLYFTSVKMEKDEVRIKANYKNELSNFNLSLISKTIKKINIRTHFLIGLTIIFVPLAGSGLFLLFSEIVDTTALAETRFELFLWQIISFFGIIIFYNALLLISSFILIKKKTTNEVSDGKLINDFSKFVHEWIQTYGTEKVSFHSTSNNKKVDQAFNKLQVKLNPLLKKYQRKFPHTYEFWYIDRFRTYLDAIDKYLAFFKTININNSIPIILSENNQPIHLENIRFLIIHNYLCGIYEINFDNKIKNVSLK